MVAEWAPKIPGWTAYPLSWSSTRSARRQWSATCWWCFAIAGATAVVALFIYLLLPKLDEAIKKYGA